MKLSNVCKIKSYVSTREVGKVLGLCPANEELETIKAIHGYLLIMT